MNRLAKTLYWLLFGFVCAWPLLAIRESLWVDELHSAWVADGSWSQVAERSSIGNQSPLYFYLLKGNTLAWRSGFGATKPYERTSTLAESSYRSLSWLAWCALVGLIAWRCRVQPLVGYVIAVWLFFDRVGHFYAIETRPYIFVVLFSWLLIESIAKSNLEAVFQWRWLGCALTLFYLHYTALIFLFWSWIALAYHVGQSSPNARGNERWLRFGMSVVTGISFVVLAAPGLMHLLSISRESQQWNQFAGDYGLLATIDILPWAMWCVVPGGILIFDRTLGRSQSDSRTLFSSKELRIATVLGIGTLGTIWCMTYFKLAPLMHHRYAIGVYPAILAIGIQLLSRIRSVRSLSLAGVLSVAWLIGWQGTWREWQAYQFVPWQRMEDWRGVGRYLGEHAQSTDAILIAPMLIETQGFELSPSIPQDYLTCPLQTIYAPYEISRLVPVANDSSAWIKAARRHVSLQPKQAVWLVVRSTWADLESDEEWCVMSRQSVEFDLEITLAYQGGRVQLYRIVGK